MFPFPKCFRFPNVSVSQMFLFPVLGPHSTLVLCDAKKKQQIAPVIFLLFCYFKLDATISLSLIIRPFQRKIVLYPVRA